MFIASALEASRPANMLTISWWELSEPQLSLHFFNCINITEDAAED